MKHSTLIRNKGGLTTGGSWNLGGHKILGDKRGGEKKIFPLKRGEQKTFMKRIFWVLYFACIEICSKTLLLEHLDYHEQFCCPFAAKISQYLF